LLQGIALMDSDQRLQQLIVDQCDDDTAIRALGAQVMPESEVYGDSYGVPTAVDLVEKLVVRLKHAQP
jgi:hypothetical protein